MSNTNYINGKTESHDSYALDINLLKIVDVKKKVKARVLGFPVSLKDIVTDTIQLVKTPVNIDGSGLVNKVKKRDG